MNNHNSNNNDNIIILDTICCFVSNKNGKRCIEQAEQHKHFCKYHLIREQRLGEIFSSFINLVKDNSKQTIILTLLSILITRINISFVISV